MIYITKGITKEEFDILKPKCQCPCNQLISWKESYRYKKIPKFIRGHQQKILPIITEVEFNIIQPRCQCPCNELIPWKNHYKSFGIPDYIKGHNHKKSNVSIGISKEQFDATAPHYCNCLDKEIIPWKEYYAQRGISNYIKGHQNKGRKHTDEAKKRMSNNQQRKTAWNKGIPCTEERKSKLIGKLSGEKHPNWNGGSSFFPYCKLFNRPLKEAVRNRDNSICQLCNKTEEENGQKHSVHHIHYDKENCEPDLITLCRGCNAKVNQNRDYYENLFMNMLNDRKLLFWTKRIIKK